jgi:hypothetical protein
VMDLTTRRSVADEGKHHKPVYVTRMPMPATPKADSQISSWGPRRRMPNAAEYQIAPAVSSGKASNMAGIRHFIETLISGDCQPNFCGGTLIAHGESPFAVSCPGTLARRRGIPVPTL